MKKSVLFILSLVLLLLAGCTVSESDKPSPVRPRNKVSRAAVDDSPYKNVTLSNVNALLISKYDFSSVANGRYCNGDSYIDVDFSKGKVILYTPECGIEKYKGKSFYSEFIYDVKGASSDVLYLCPLTRNKVVMKIGEEKVKAQEGPGFALYVPFYGFGKSRLEVSSILNGEIMMPSGTYWKK